MCRAYAKNDAKSCVNELKTMHAAALKTIETSGRSEFNYETGDVDEAYKRGQSALALCDGLLKAASEHCKK